MDKNEMKTKEIWAVIGATPDHDKFGYRILRHLLDLNKKVYAINPKYGEIEGIKCYKNLAELPELPEVLDFVVAPSFGKEYVNEAAELGIKNLWLQPGTYNEALLKLAEEKGLNVVKACVLVEL